MAPRILIVEDNDHVAAYLETLLRRRGLEPDRVSDGLSARQRIADAPPDVLLLDLKIPGLHGVELLKELRRQPATRQLPVVVTTGAYRGERYARAARSLGVAAYLEKPFRAADLYAALAPLCSAPAAGVTMDRHLQRAFTTRFSGRYRFHAGDGERCLSFLGGLPMALSPGFRHENFGDYLRRRGQVSVAEYGFYCGEGGQRPESLVQMGCLSYHEMLQQMLAYLTEELVAAFELPPLSVEEDPLNVPGALDGLFINVPQTIYQGFHRHGASRGRRLLSVYGGQYVAPARDYFRYINFLSLDEAERRMLLRLDGQRTLADILAGENGLLPLLATLHLFGMVRFAPALLAPAAADFPLRLLFNAAEEEPPAADEEKLESFVDVVEAAEPGLAEELLAPAPPEGVAPQSGDAGLGERLGALYLDLQKKNYYAIFGLEPGTFSFERLREEYFRLTRICAPETLMLLSGEDAEQAEALLSLVTTAYGTLSDVVKKERYDELLGAEKVGLGQEGDDRFQAQVQFQSGKVFLEMEEWDNAEKSLQDACRLEPENGEFLSHLAWAIYRNPGNGMSRAVIEKARQLAARALVLERTAAGFAYKGWMLLDAGQDALAEADFHKALKSDPRHMLARRGLRAVEAKREAERKGLFRRLFH